MIGLIPVCRRVLVPCCEDDAAKAGEQVQVDTSKVHVSLASRFDALAGHGGISSESEADIITRMLMGHSRSLDVVEPKDKGVEQIPLARCPPAFGDNGKLQPFSGQEGLEQAPCVSNTPMSSHTVDCQAPPEDDDEHPVDLKGRGKNIQLLASNGGVTAGSVFYGAAAAAVRKVEESGPLEEWPEVSEESIPRVKPPEPGAIRRPNGGDMMWKDKYSADVGFFEVGTLADIEDENECHHNRPAMLGKRRAGASREFEDPQNDDED